MPHAGALMPLIGMLPRLAKAVVIQDSQAVEVDRLRTKSAMVIAEWYKILILQEGEQWSEYEQRIARIEQVMRRMENARIREHDEI